MKKNKKIWKKMKKMIDFEKNKVYYKNIIL